MDSVKSGLAPIHAVASEPVKPEAAEAREERAAGAMSATGGSVVATAPISATWNQPTSQPAWAAQHGAVCRSTWLMRVEEHANHGGRQARFAMF